MAFGAWNELSRFQAALVAMLFASVFASFAGALFALLTVVAFNFACALLALRMGGGDRPGAFAMIVFFTFLSLAAVVFRVFLVSPYALVFALPAMAVFFLAFFAVYRIFFLKNSARAVVLGYSNGFAIVRVAAGFSHDVPAGVYAVPSAPVAAGEARLLLEKKWLSASKLSGVEQAAPSVRKGKKK